MKFSIWIYKHIIIQVNIYKTFRIFCDYYSLGWIYVIHCNFVLKGNVIIDVIMKM